MAILLSLLLNMKMSMEKKCIRLLNFVIEVRQGIIP